MADLNERLAAAKDNAVLQAQIWAQEARTQRATVLDILRYFGLPEHDYEALRLILEAFPMENAECTCAPMTEAGALEWTCPKHGYINPAGVKGGYSKTFCTNTPTGERAKD